MGVLDDYLVDPRLSLLDKTRIRAQVLVPVLRTLRSETGEGEGRRDCQAGLARLVKAAIRFRRRQR